jgi:S-adenosylmethionine:tRNA ribosyltransferase-isomerase
MDSSLFDYHLPKELIAQFPARKREGSRLLVLDRESGSLEHCHFKDLVRFLQSGDVLVVNNTKVFKARLLGRRATGGVVEVFLIRPEPDAGEEVWEAMARPSRRLRDGDKVFFDDGRHLTLRQDMNNGRWRVGFTSRSAREKILARHGHVPLPQYIRRDDQPEDIRRYQTIFADRSKTGAVAAPTAGFHFSKPILNDIKAKGVKVLEVTLHVGPGTISTTTRSMPSTRNSQSR